MDFSDCRFETEIHPVLEKMLLNDTPTLGDALGMKMLSVSPNELRASMPVDARTRQPAGLLHGGASVAFAETLCSIGAWLHMDPEKEIAVGLEINANHIRAVRAGNVIGIAKPLHIGSQTQVWTCDIETEDGKRVCTSRCTLMIIRRR